jgi:mannose-6-phosphate isomerase-like protein (cupin superfamily)
MKHGFHTNIEQVTQTNETFRTVLYTAQHCQLVVMTLKPGQEIGEETHPDNDQFFRFESGEGKVIINDSEYHVGDGHAVIIPAGSQHNVINTSVDKDLKMYTIYSPAHHEDGTVHITKIDAEESHEEFAGVTTE